MTTSKLLDPGFLRRLEHLRIRARRAFPGTMRGERRSTRRGSSVEFADFRKYEAGDDYRHVDWNIYARLDRLMLRQFVEEEDVRVDILLDQSDSMMFGETGAKFDFGRRVAAGLAFLAISSLDRAALLSFDSAIRRRLRALRGRAHLLNLLAVLDALETAAVAKREGAATNGLPTERGGSSTNLEAVLKAYQRGATRSGITFIISDFLDESDFRRQLLLMAQRGFDVNLVQIIAPEEVEPVLAGDLLLLDVETGETREITVNQRTLAAYRKALDRFTTSLAQFCRGSGLGYTRFRSDENFEDAFIRHLGDSRIAE